jgi:NAD(P)-dependent dehydrogenase (short-subunit alcohol dehydrogenase family)
VVVTGASSGFGNLTARALAEAGHIVYAGMRATADRNAPAVAALARLREERGVLSAPTNTMARSLLTLDTATCAHRDGDTEQACRQATAVLADLPTAYRTGLVHHRALDLYRSIPARHHPEIAVRELRDVLSA